MRRRLARSILLGCMVLLLAVLPLASGCGGGDGDTGKAEVKLGWLWDLTGRSALAVIQVYNALNDLLDKTKAENPLPDLDVKIVTYDTKSDPARVVPGYVWLKGQGCKVMSASPQDCEMLRTQFEADHIPFFEVSNMLSTLDSSWLFSVYGTPEGQIEILMDYVIKTWDGAARPKISYIGFAGVPFYEAQGEMTELLAIENKDKVEWTGIQMVPATTQSWAQVTSTVGPMA